jgi:hypothetical protein
MPFELRRYVMWQMGHSDHVSLDPEPWDNAGERTPLHIYKSVMANRVVLSIINLQNAQTVYR